MMQRGRRSKVTVAACAVATVALITLAVAPAGAGSSAGSGTGSSAGTTKVGMYGPVADNDLGTSFPESVSAVRAGIRAINKAGGLQGKDLELVFCDPHEDANEAGDCARKFVDEGVVAVVGSFSVHGDVINPILQDASIADVGMAAVGPADFTAPNSFPIDGGTLTAFPSVVIALGEAGNKSVFQAGVDVAQAAALEGFDRAAAEAAGMEWSGSVAVPLAAPDFAPYVAAAVDSGAASVVLALSDADTTKFIVAANDVGADFAIGASDGAIGVDALDTLGDQAAGILLSGSWPPPSAGKEFPTIARFNKELKAQFKSGDEDANPKLATSSFSIRPWLALQAVAQVIEALPSSEVTAPSVLEGMRTATFDFDGLVPAFSWTQPPPISIFPRVANTSVFSSKVNKNLKIVLVSPEPIDIAKEVDFAAALGG